MQIGRPDLSGRSILVIEGEDPLRELLKNTLEQEGYLVYATGDGEDALEMARRFSPYLVILGLMLPRLASFAVCRILVQETDAQILVLSTESNECDRVVYLEMGADDCIVKPFSMRELLARIRARFRRSPISLAAPNYQSPQILSSNKLELNLTSYTASQDGKILELKPREFQLLALLVRNKGRVCTRSYILQNIWRDIDLRSDHTMAVHVRWLREKIEPDPSHPTRIITIRSIGYRFEG
jgi:DNA-binding response OmpR family regulator